MDKCNNMQNVLRYNKSYNVFDYIKIPFKAAPFVTMIIVLNRVFNAFIPAIKVFITSKFVNDAINVVREEKDFIILLPTICGFAAIVVYSRISTAIINNFINVRYDMKIYSRVQAEVIDIRSKMLYENVENLSIYNLIERVGGDVLGNVARGMNNVLDVVETYIHIYALTTIIILNHAWWAGIVIIIISFILTKISIISGKRVYKAYTGVIEKKRLSDYYEKVLIDRDHVNERKIFAFSDYINSKWRKSYSDTVNVRVKARAKSVLEIESVGILLTIIASIVTVLMVPNVINHTMSVGMFVAVTTAIYELSSELGWRFVNVSRTYSECKEYLNDLTMFCSLKMDNWEDKEEIAEEFESIEFIDVSFKYSNTDKYILKNLSVKFEKNEHYAIVGINGAGKSTLIKIMLGLYKNYEGKILLNGKDIRELSCDCIQRIFSVTFQDFAKYQISMRDNYALGNKEITEESIWNIISKLGCDKFMKKMPKGLNTLIGKIYDDSLELSGGEWQKVALVRNFVKKSSVKILDEPTAALDPILESDMYTMFANLCNKNTTILITHRLAAVKSANKIIVLDDGHVKESGTHEELLDKGGLYAQMYANQTKWYVNNNERI